MTKQHIVCLSKKERDQLLAIVRVGRDTAYRRLWARILLKVDEGEYGPSLSDVEAADALETTTRTVERLRSRFFEEGLEMALSRKRQRTLSRQPALDDHAIARLIEMCCSEPPVGHEHWTLCLLADQLMRQDVVESVSRETIRRTLKKAKLRLR